MKKEATIILSGGMDSTTLLYDIINEFDSDKVTALSFNYNQRHKKELILATKTCEKLKVEHKIISLEILNDLAISALTRDEIEVPEGHYEAENMKLTVVPNRNMIMLSLAASYAMSRQIPRLYCGVHSGDHAIYPDCRRDFIESMAESLSLADWNSLELIAPYLEFDKADIVKRGLELRVDYSLTWTCYKGLEYSCGKCGSCVERIEAFKKNKSIDPIKYIKGD